MARWKRKKRRFLRVYEKTALDNGYDNIDYEALEELSSTMERYFLKFEFKYIKRLRAYVDIVSNHVEECAWKISQCILIINIPCGIINLTSL